MYFKRNKKEIRIENEEKVLVLKRKVLEQALKDLVRDFKEEFLNLN